MNVLLLTDFSTDAKQAAAYAMRLFEDFSVTFHFLHITPVRVQRSTDALPPEIEKKFEELLQWAHGYRRNPNHKLTTSYRVNYFIEAVRDLGWEEDIDLIVMGTKGTVRSKEHTVGPNTSDVMRKVNIPLLIVSPDTPCELPKRMLFPTDYSVKCTPPVLKSLEAMASANQSRVLVLESLKNPVLTDDQQGQRKFLEKEYNCEFSPLSALPKVEPPLGIPGDVLVVMARNLRLWGKFFRTRQLPENLHFSGLPLLVLH